MSNLNINEKGYIYGKWMTKDNTYTIAYGNVYCYLLIGDKKALLIDTAYGEGNIREFVEQITDKPMLVANTHGHFDHTGGNPWWQEVYASKGSLDDIKAAFSPEMQEEFNKKPYPDYKVNQIGDGYKFDLGNRTVEVIDIPSHHSGSVAFLDSGSKYLFCGDELEAGQVLMFKDMKTQITAHKANMEKLKVRFDEFEAICPAHNGTPINKKYIEDYIILDTQLLDGTQTIMPNTAGYGFPADVSMFGVGTGERAQYGGASICYVKD